MSENAHDPKMLIRQGKLQEARGLLVADLRQRPNDTGARTLLFQVLLFQGDLEKAARHLEALTQLASDRGPALMQCMSLLHSEQERMSVLSLSGPPSYFPETPSYFNRVYPCFQVGGSRDGRAIDAEAATRVPRVGGWVNGQKFDGLRNADDLLAHALEIFAHDRYLWVPFEAIREILMEPPANLLDLYWIPVSVTTWSGLSINGHLPVLYPFSWQHADPMVQMGRMTDWLSEAGGLVRGRGQQVFLFGALDLPLLEIRQVSFSMPESVQQ